MNAVSVRQIPVLRKASVKFTHATGQQRQPSKLKLDCVQAQAQAQAQQAAVEAHHLDHTAQQLQVKAQTVSHLRTEIARGINFKLFL